MSKISHNAQLTGDTHNHRNLDHNGDLICLDLDSGPAPSKLIRSVSSPLTTFPRAFPLFTLSQPLHVSTPIRHLPSTHTL